jgi:hypothetical protein
VPDTQGVDPQPGQRGGQAALTDFAAGATAWLDIRRHRGLAAAARVTREVLTNATPPTAAHLIDPAPVRMIVDRYPVMRGVSIHDDATREKTVRHLRIH